MRADKDFDAHFKLAASDYFSKHTTAPWAKTLNAELKKAGIAPLTIGSPAHLSAGITAVEKAMAEWFEPKRTQWKKKDTWVKRLEEHLKKAHRCAFFAPMLNDLRARTEAALSKNKALFDTLKVDEDEATLSIGDQAAGVTKELRAAVRSLGIVKFLTTLGATGSAAGVSFAHFADPTHPLGFHFRDSANKLANSAYIKERFRKVSPQNHEWIPCNKILDTVQRDMDAPATDTAPEAIDEAQRTARPHRRCLREQPQSHPVRPLGTLRRPLPPPQIGPKTTNHRATRLPRQAPGPLRRPQGPRRLHRRAKAVGER